MIEIKFITVRKFNPFNWNSLINLWQKQWRKLTELFHTPLKHNMSEKPEKILEKKYFKGVVEPVYL